MDRLYFKIVEAAMETAQLANHLVMNANYRNDVDVETRQHLVEYYTAVHSARDILYHAVGRQMAKDPQERDIPINRQRS